MEWFNQFGADKQPSAAEIDAFIANPLWAEMNSFLRDGYGAELSYSYSACSNCAEKSK